MTHSLWVTKQSLKELRNRKGSYPIVFWPFNWRFDCRQWSRNELKRHPFFLTWNFWNVSDLMNIYGPSMACTISKTISNFVPSNPTKQMEHSNGPKTSFEPLFSRMCRSRHHNISLKSHSKHFVQTLVKILIFGLVSTQDFQV